MKIQVKFKNPGYADCDISIRAKGFMVAIIYWAAEQKVLSGWSSLAAIPIDPAGNGGFRFSGGRAIPTEATQVCTRCISWDLVTTEEVYTEIPEDFRISGSEGRRLADFSIMSDLHLSAKAGTIKRALGGTASSSILLCGDLSNDGFTEQFALFKKCIEEMVPEKTVFSVTGNHDQLHTPDPELLEEYEGYQVFQDYLLKRAENQGSQIERGPSGAYAVKINGIDIIGLQCVSDYRKFVFQKGEQLKWLAQHLEESAGWHIILCHAPLLAHNPHRNDGAPYLSRDEELQKIVDNHRKIIFISGHTHISPNMEKNCVEYIPDNQSVYINDGSVTPTELNGEALMPADWKDGVQMELVIWDKQIEIKTKSVYTGICYPRGYYRIDYD